MSENTTFFNISERAKKSILFLMVTFVSLSGFTQRLTDSLFKELDLIAQSDTNKFNEIKAKWSKSFDFTEYDKCALMELEGNKFHYRGDDFTAKTFYQKSNGCSKEFGNRKIELSTRIKMIWLDLAREFIDYEEAIEQAKIALLDATKYKDTSRMVMAFNALANFHIDISEKEKGIGYYYDALKISQAPKYYLDRVTILINLGNINNIFDDKSGAIKYLREGLKIIENKQQYRLEARVLTNLALTYTNDSTGRDSAFYYYQKAMEISRITGEPELLLASYANLGVYHNFNGENELCRQYYDSAIHYVEKHHLVGKQGKIYLGLTDFYINQNKINQAFKMINIGAQKVAEEDYPKLEDQMSYERMFYRLYEATGNAKKALYHNVRYHQYKDTLRDSYNEKLLAELDLKYEDEKRLAEIEKQKSRADLAEKRQEIIQTESSLNIMRYTAIFIGIILLIGIIFSLYVIKNVNAKKKMEQLYASNLISEIEDERSRISSDLHDHIGLNLIMVKNQLNKTPENSKVVDEVSNIVEDVRKISRNIYPSQLNKLGIRKSIETMFDKIESSTGIVTSHEIESLDEIEFGKGEELILYRIIQELGNNSIKHSQSKSIRLVASVAPKKLSLEYRDNGIGFDKSKIMETSKGMGLRNIINRVEKIGGNIQFESKKNQGIKVSFSFDRSK